MQISFFSLDVERESNLSAVPTNLYDSSLCVPDLGVYIEYNHSPILPGDDRKPILTTPAPSQTPTPSTPATNNNNFLEGKSFISIHIIPFFFFLIANTFAHTFFIFFDKLIIKKDINISQNKKIKLILMKYMKITKKENMK